VSRQEEGRLNIVDALFGRPLATEEEKAERIGPLKGIPIFGLDALSSAAYGPEAALTLLIPLGMAGAAYVWPITVGIVVLLSIVYFSYRQTISAYPQGGGSYTVASENLGEGFGLLAAAALMIDYVLTAAVGISAGVGALVSAVPSLQSRTLTLCLGILIIITIINLRGVQETGGVFLLPTYIFIACLLGLIAVGTFKVLAAGGHPAAVVAPPKFARVTGSVSAWLLLRTFSSGCTAMTGVEAVSNGVMAFREPTDKYAKLTLTIIIAILMVMLLGIAYLVPAYGIAATDPADVVFVTQHVRQRHAIYRCGERLTIVRVLGNSAAATKYQGDDICRLGPPDVHVGSLCRSHFVGGELHEIGAAQLEINPLIARRAAHQDFDSIEEWARPPAIFGGGQGDLVGRELSDVKRAGADRKSVLVLAKNGIFGSRHLTLDKPARLLKPQTR
jgi:hypothetical protein